jgi:hypothetical protein
MKWTVKLIAEARPGESVEHEVASIERGEVVSPASVGLTIAEGKTILAPWKMHSAIGIKVSGQSQIHPTRCASMTTPQLCILSLRSYRIARSQASG